MPVVVVFQSAEGGEFPMNSERPQLAGLVSEFEKEVGRRSVGPPTPGAQATTARPRCSHCRMASAEKTKMARRLTFKVELPDQAQTLILRCVLVPEDVEQAYQRFVVGGSVGSNDSPCERQISIGRRAWLISHPLSCMRRLD